MKNEIKFEELKNIMRKDVNSKNLIENKDIILQSMVDLPTRCVIVKVRFFDFTDIEFGKIVNAIKEYGRESEYTILSTPDGYIFIATVDYDKPIVCIDIKDKSLHVCANYIYPVEFKDDLNNIREFIEDDYENIIKEPVEKILGDDDPLYEKVCDFTSNTVLSYKTNPTWDLLEKVSSPNTELDKYCNVEKNWFDEFTYYITIFSNIDLIGMYQSERIIDKFRKALDINLMLLSNEESLPVSSILRDFRLLKKLKYKTLDFIISKEIQKLINEEKVGITDDRILSNMVNRYTDYFNLVLNCKFIELDIKPNLNGFRRMKKISKIYDTCLKEYRLFITVNLDTYDNWEKYGLLWLYIVNEQDIEINKAAAISSLKSNVDDLMARLNSRFEERQIEDGEIKLN